MRALLIMGPTASGKSALALALAEELGGEIVNADSMQVYRDWRALTARPTPSEEAQAPHHLYGHVDAGERYSVGRWLKDATETIADIRGRGRTPIVVGGTGLYFKALTEGLSEAPPFDPYVRAHLGEELKANGPEALHAKLAARDPEAAADIYEKDYVRTIRALELAEAGASVAAPGENKGAIADWVGVALAPERKALYAAIDARFEAMLAGGALEEARQVAARALDPLLPAMKAHGAPWLMAHLRGEMTLERAAELGKRDTRRYAKRQFTWIAHQLRGAWTRAEAALLADRVAAARTALGLR